MVAVRAELALNDDCTAVTVTLHDVLLEDLLDVLTAVGQPEVAQEWVAGVHAQIPLKQAGLGETRKTIRVKVKRPV